MLDAEWRDVWELTALPLRHRAMKRVLAEFGTCKTKKGRGLEGNEPFRSVVCLSEGNYGLWSRVGWSGLVGYR